MRDNLNAPPINPLPWVVWALALPMIAVEVVVAAGEYGLAGGAAGIGWRLDALNRFAVFPELWDWMVQNHTWPPEMLWRYVTYPFINGSTTQAVFVIVILLALGKMVGEVFRWWAVLVVFFGATIISGLIFCMLPYIESPLYGGYPGTYGLIGAFTWLLWTKLRGTGSTQYRAFTMIGFLMGAQLLFAALFGTGPWWIAELIGFATGFLISFAVSPGGIGRLRARMRQR